MTSPIVTIEMYQWWRESNRNVVAVVVVVEGNNRSVAVVVYSFTIYEAVLKVECRVDVGSMWGRCRVTWGRCGIDVGSMWGRCRVARRSMYLWMEKCIE